MSYVEKSRGKCGEFLVSFNISSFLRVKKFATCLSVFIPHSTDSKENEYKLWVRRFLESFSGWTSVSYDWSAVFKATINQSQVTPVQMIPEIIVPKACTHSP